MSSRDNIRPLKKKKNPVGRFEAGEKILVAEIGADGAQSLKVKSKGMPSDRTINGNNNTLLAERE